MRRTVSLLTLVFALAVGIGIGLTPRAAEAYPCGPCYIGCKNGQEILCCQPVQSCGCKIILGSEC